MHKFCVCLMENQVIEQQQTKQWVLTHVKVILLLFISEKEMAGKQTTDNVSACEKSPKLQLNKNPPCIDKSPSKAVNFPCDAEGGQRREKYLTAKYGAHQMAMIRKRLKVEMWMFDQLQIICQDEVS